MNLSFENQPASVCLLFQVHKPYLLRNYPFDRIGHDHAWEDSPANIAILNRIADNCYLPANRALLQSIRQSDGKFRLAFSLSGTLLEQLSRYRPDVLESFRQLGATGSVEFLAETYYHSLAAIYSPSEFRRQVVKHEKAIQNMLEVRPTVFRNTELLFADGLLPSIDALGYKTIIAEGKSVNGSLKNMNQVFWSAQKPIRVIPRNSVLSDEISFRFGKLASHQRGPAAAFAEKLMEESDQAHCICIGFDFETFGEQFTAESGIFDFLENLAPEVLKRPRLEFCLPSDADEGNAPEKPVYNSPEWSSWAGTNKDTDPWCLGAMQKDALEKLYACEPAVLKSGRPDLLDQWGRLQTSDHFYFMGNRQHSDSMPERFNPYPSPYDAYLNYMNVLSDFRRLLEIA